MKTVFLLFDSLNRHMLGPYGGMALPTPNFDRLAKRSITFDNHYVGSLPCMPARRDMLTGRLSFLHRSWGPVEPFDQDWPTMLYNKGLYSHLVTDHFHYWEDGGATYHTRYDSCETVRGQEGDRWKAVVKPDWDHLRTRYHERQFSTARRSYPANNILNRETMREEKDYPTIQTFDHGLDFIVTNKAADGWVLQLETFSPHEPFTAPPRFREPFKTGWNGPVRDWPRYERVDESDEEAAELRANYLATVAMCDEMLGRVLDAFDRDDLWKDTALIVSTDHGFLLGEHDFWAKNRMNLYSELARIPLFVHLPGETERDGTRSDALTQSIDFAPTILELNGLEPGSHMQGLSLQSQLSGEKRREAALYGYFGAAVNVTDGKKSYHRFPADIASQEIYQYTLMPTHIFAPFSTEELAGASLAEPFGFTDGAKLLKVPVIHRSPFYKVYGPGALLEDTTRLYDLEADPKQATPLEDAEEEKRFCRLMAGLMAENEAPPEAFTRIGLDREGRVAEPLVATA
ncbi:MAG: sulfatase [Devosia sp.]